MASAEATRGRLLPLYLKLVSLALAVVIFLFSWTMLGHWFYAHHQIVDTYVYETYGLNVRDGQTPYRDFAVEYPPGALAAFVAPTFVGHPRDLDDYGKWFARSMAACGLLCLLFVWLARPPRHALWFVAISPILIGSVVLSRFDFWPTMLVTGAVVAFVRDRHRLGWAALGAGFAAKIFGAVLIPIAIVWTLRRRGRRELAIGLATWLAVTLAAFGYFLAVAPHGLWESIHGQISRPIQIESLVASYLTTFASPAVIVAHDALAIAGYHTLGLLSTVAQVVALVLLWIGFARGPAEPDRFVRYCAACVCAFVAFGKVLSPQYLIWLVPLVALVRGWRGLAAVGLLTAALVDTLVWFPARYDAYINYFDLAWLVFVRNLLVVALLAVLALPRSPRHAKPVPR